MQTNSTHLHAKHRPLRAQQERTMTDREATLSYDGSFNGFLTAIWQARKMNQDRSILLEKHKPVQTSVFGNHQFVLSNQAIAQHLWHELERNNNPSAKLTYFAFLAEKKYLTRALFIHLSRTNYSEFELHEELTLQLEKAALEVQKEKKRLEKSIQLSRSSGPLWFAELQPKTNVIPLLSRCLKQRYAGNDWFIWDDKRHYGLLCENGKCSFTNKKVHLRSALAS